MPRKPYHYPELLAALKESLLGLGRQSVSIQMTRCSRKRKTTSEKRLLKLKAAVIRASRQISP